MNSFKHRGRVDVLEKIPFLKGDIASNTLYYDVQFWQFVAELFGHPRAKFPKQILKHIIF